MVSFEAASQSPDDGKIKRRAEGFQDSSRKRKQQDHHLHDEYQSAQLEKRSKTNNTKSIFGVELHFETPLPSEWQRCLDVKSGQIHFFNTRTQSRTFEDPTGSTAYNMSLDLELNLLPCDSVRKLGANDQSSKQNDNSGSSSDILMDLNQKYQNSNIPGLTLSRSPSLLAVDGDDDQQEQQEMVTTVCMRCHMLVMLCKSSPACPNCKFMHPPEQSFPKLFKPSRLSLLC